MQNTPKPKEIVLTYLFYSGLNILNAPPAALAFPARLCSFLLLMSFVTSFASLVSNPLALCAACSVFGVKCRLPFLVSASLLLRLWSCFLDMSFLTPTPALFLFLEALAEDFALFKGFCIAEERANEREGKGRKRRVGATREGRKAPPPGPVHATRRLPGIRGLGASSGLAVGEAPAPLPLV